MLLTLLALPALAGDYALTATAAGDAKITRAMNRANRETCKYYGQAIGCTQAQARKEFCRRAGFGGVTTCTPDPTSTPQNPKPQICTTTPLVANCDGASQVNIFATAQEFAQAEFTELVKGLGAKNDAEDKTAARAAWPTLTQAQRDAFCSSLGLAAQCDPW